jgi:hypothetical protein
LKSRTRCGLNFENDGPQSKSKQPNWLSTGVNLFRLTAVFPKTCRQSCD